MKKRVSVSEAKNQLSAVMDWAVENPDGVIVECHGRPKAAIVSYDEYQQLLTLREQERRREALRELQELAERMRARNADLTKEEADEIADELTRETLERMVREGEIKYEP